MTSITKQHIGKHTYLYQSTSYRDPQGRPRNKKTKIGKIDPNTGQTIYTTQPNQTTNPQPNNIKEIIDNTKNYGTHYFLTQIAQKTNLLKTLQTTFPNNYQEIFTLASYLITQDKPVMYYQDWLSENQWPNTNNMTSQRISELLNNITQNQRNQFYKLWYKQTKEPKYIALDITSISSHSKQREECEWGYNRDRDKLPQINLCMLFGETSRLPIYQTSYSGSLSDVSTLDCTTAEFTALFGKNDTVFVMDKGFFSKKNIDLLLERGVNFLVSVPFMSKFVRQLVRRERGGIDCLENFVVTSGDPIRGVHRKVVWNEAGVVLEGYVLFDPVRALLERNELFSFILRLKEFALVEGVGGRYAKEIERYLVVERSVGGGFVVGVREGVVEAVLECCGWCVLLSNHVCGVQVAFDVYRLRDVVEKGFWRFKGCLGLERLRVHSDSRAECKEFVGFVALVLLSYIDNVMRTCGLYGSLTIDGLFLLLAKLKSVTIGGQHILRPLTKQQKELFKAFDIPIPVG